MDEYNNMNPNPNGSPEPQQPNYASQYNQQPQQPDYASQYNQQPQQPDYSAQYNQQPQQPDYNAQQYGQYDNYAQPPVQQYSQPVNNYNVQGDTYSGKVRAFSIVSLACGIASLIFGWFGWSGLFFCIPAIIFSTLAKKNYSGKNGMATVGLIFGIIGAVITTIMIFVWCFAISKTTTTYRYYY